MKKILFILLFFLFISCEKEETCTFKAFINNHTVYDSCDYAKAEFDNFDVIKISMKDLIKGTNIPVKSDYVTITLFKDGKEVISRTQFVDCGDVFIF